MRYLIIGNSAAGLSAAKALRTVDQAGEITIVSEEQGWGYSRIFLPELIKGRITENQLFSRGPGWYGERNIALRHGCRVVALDPGRRLARLASGEELLYDRLLLTTGAKAVLPKLPGAQSSGVFPLRTIVDARAIKRLAERKKRAVVLGGGLVGLKAAEALATLGLRVTVGVSSGHILSRQMDKDGAMLVQDAFEKAGVAIRTDCSPVGLEANGAGWVCGVDFGAGGRVPADLVILAKGVSPQVDLALQCGLQVGQGIYTNERMETSLPGVYAAGDAAEAYISWSGRRKVLPIWPVAAEQGRVAGLNMAGLQVQYQGFPPMNITQMYHLNIASAGSLSAQPDDVIIRSTGDGVYRFAVIRGERLAGAMEVGALSGVGLLPWLLRKKVKLSAEEMKRMYTGFGSLHWLCRDQIRWNQMDPRGYGSAQNN